ncbi:hypothetical protein GCM10011381_40290 [Klenkia taihuensis]|uniref:DUF4245 domain-containing protein n=2 Tax=Klenkia taihuensis TaxID=1225127 RepID=A0A1I1MTL7_9ACTN|nr:hypothetical protein GCM10011381_40290 [Klenkia taihuensis]SFC84920.1 Protein of unknown function [Klenkia taihuensis]
MVASSSQERAAKFTAANMVRSLLPLTVIVLALVGLTSLRQNDVDPVREVETTSGTQLAAARASFPLLVPQGLPDDWRATSITTDAGDATEAGDPVTLSIGYVTPDEEYAGFVIGDEPRAEDLARVLDGRSGDTPVEIGGEEWTQTTTARGETAYLLDAEGATVAVTGSATDDELRTLAASVQPYQAG